MDFITDLPKSEKYDAILVIVNRFTKMTHFIPTIKAIIDATTARLFLRYIFRLLGLLEDIVSDREQYKYYADQHHVQNPSYQIAYIVWLLRNNLQTFRPYAKLDHQIFGPFIMLAKINPVTFKLQFPSPSPPIEIDDHEEFEVEHVLDSRTSRGRLEYLIHWKGYAISDRNWEPTENLERAPIKVR
ncbi:hypothetical protein KP509_14G085900 [Ceratopteris richardii]|uniref:Chromo domain-containing protein n=1 Tax=Ceratopteris richardii TaxID=49495 RepID=A0A8T2T9Y1_CERRI|nr:hypothetical protein KP509_14G085900 [Ceratopteris richardii]